jgi:hypothetical protein
MSIRVAFGRFCSLISKGGGGRRQRSICVQLDGLRGWICSQQLVGRRIMKCLYRKTLWVIERLVTTNVKGASSPRMLLLERKEGREEKGQGTLAGSSGLRQTTDGGRRLRGGEYAVLGPLPGLGLPSFGVGWEVDWP